MPQIQRIETTRNDLTGEITERKATVYEVKALPPEPHYIKLYIDQIGVIHGLQAGHRDILLYLATAIGYDGLLVMSPIRKGQIARTLNIAPKSIENAIVELIRHGLLRRLSRSEFEPNPFIFGRGKWRDIRERRESFVSRVRFGPAGVEPLGIEPASKQGSS